MRGDRVRRLMAAAVATAALVVAPAGQASAHGPTWRQAARATSGSAYTTVVCGRGGWGHAGHTFNDHYWRTGFCTGRYSQYPQILNLRSDKTGDSPAEWSAFEDAREGALARVALARGVAPTLRGWDQVCGVYGDC